MNREITKESKEAKKSKVMINVENGKVLNPDNAKQDMRAIEVMQFNEERVDLGEVVPLTEPLVIYVEPSSFCNLECTFCPQHISPGEIHKKNMSLETFKKMIDDIKAFPKKPKLMRFCGLGDSLFNKNFLEMAQYANEAKVVEKIELITNGLLFNDSLISHLPFVLDRIIISVEGLSNDDYMEFAKKKIDFKEFVSKVEKLGNVNGKCMLHVKIHNAAIGTEERKSFFYQTFGPICDQIFIENLVDLWPQVTSNLGVESGHRFDGGPLNKVKVCPQIFKSMQVNSDGRVIPCCIDWRGVNIIGDINNEKLSDVWNGSTLKKLRNVHLNGKRFEIDPCKGCTMNEYTEKDNLDSVADFLYDKINQ